jgi:hypothetical protein
MIYDQKFCVDLYAKLNKNLPSLREKVRFMFVSFIYCNKPPGV